MKGGGVRPLLAARRGQPGGRLRTCTAGPGAAERRGAGGSQWGPPRPCDRRGGRCPRRAAGAGSRHRAPRRSAASSAAVGLTHASILLSSGSRSHTPRRGEGGRRAERNGTGGAAADKAKMAGILAWFWNERFWLPHNVTWADLQSTEEAAFPQAEDLYLAFPLAFCIFMIRLLFER